MGNKILMKKLLIFTVFLSSCCCQQLGTIPSLRPTPKWLIETDPMSNEKYLVRVEKDGKNGIQHFILRKIER